MTVFLNKEVVENIRETNDTLKLYTNGGTHSTNLKCNIPEWREARFAPSGITGIFSYAEGIESQVIHQWKRPSQYTYHRRKLNLRMTYMSSFQISSRIQIKCQRNSIMLSFHQV
jgi:hypothetical protein